MKRPTWPKLRHTNPADVKEHAVSLGNHFNAVQQSLRAGVSNVTPSLPKGIERKITQGIEKGLAEVESRDYSTTSISAEDRDLISSVILEEIIAETAAAFHNRVPQYLFKILQDSYNELRPKLVSQQNAASQQKAKMPGTAFEKEIMPQTPLESPLEELDSGFLVDYGSDTEASAYRDCCKHAEGLKVQASKLKAQLDEVERERKAVSQRLREKARKAKKQRLEMEMKVKDADKRHSESPGVVEVRQSEQDRTGDYGTEAVGYDAKPVQFLFDKQDLAARAVILKIEKQAVVNRLFNMPTSILMRKVEEATSKRRTVGDKSLPSYTYLFGAELLNDGNVRLWTNNSDNYRRRSTDDTFHSPQEAPFWDKPIFASFASHLTEPRESYTVEMKDITKGLIDIQDRKQKAAAITKLVKNNLTAIPSLHIDIVKDIRFSRRTTNDNTQALVLDLSDAATANEIILRGLQWEGRHYPCEVFDIKFLDRCGYCQAYGHHADACSGPLRCGKCTEQHRTKLCRSSYRRCALCDEPHISGSFKCRAKRARVLDKHNFRFPEGKNELAKAVHPNEPKSASSAPDCATTEPNAPQEQQHVSKIQKNDPNPGSPLFHPALRDTAMELAQQLLDQQPALEAALLSDILDMKRGRGLTLLEERTHLIQQLNDKVLAIEAAVESCMLNEKMRLDVSRQSDGD